MNPIRIATSEVQPYEIAHTEAVRKAAPAFSRAWALVSHAPSASSAACRPSSAAAVATGATPPIVLLMRMKVFEAIKLGETV